MEKNNMIFTLSVLLEQINHNNKIEEIMSKIETLIVFDNKIEKRK